MALTDTKPALSLMHGKSHSWNCQVIWSGRWQEGAAATPGEEVEQINSYLSRLGSTTKNMIASGREDCITEHLLSWNKRKICNLPKLLVLRLKKTEKKLADAKTELATYAREINLSDADLDASVVSWKRDVQQFATEQKAGKNVDVGDLGEFYLLHHVVQNAQQLNTFIKQSS
ncbi:uncharacterized protein LOC114537161 isoform X1 [Dendronephthya gigantea]|nr:uncharacterized protein LOC114537161 isoform X1 [Dendronephthya gigantea]